MREVGACVVTAAYRAPVRVPPAVAKKCCEYVVVAL